MEASSQGKRRRSFTVSFKLKAVAVAEKKSKEAGKVNHSCEELLLTTKIWRLERAV